MKPGDPSSACRRNLCSMPGWTTLRLLSLKEGGLQENDELFCIHVMKSHGACHEVMFSRSRFVMPLVTIFSIAYPSIWSHTCTTSGATDIDW